MRLRDRVAVAMGVLLLVFFCSTLRGDEPGELVYSPKFEGGEGLLSVRRILLGENKNRNGILVPAYTYLIRVNDAHVWQKFFVTANLAGDPSTVVNVEFWELWREDIQEPSAEFGVRTHFSILTFPAEEWRATSVLAEFDKLGAFVGERLTFHCSVRTDGAGHYLVAIARPAKSVNVSIPPGTTRKEANLR